MSVAWNSVVGSDYLILAAYDMQAPNDDIPMTLLISNNKDCSNAFPVEATGGTYTASTLIGDPIIDNVTACGAADEQQGPGLWFRVEGTGGVIRASTCEGTVMDTQISIFTGGCGDSLECVAGNDNGCGVQSSVTWSSISGIPYFILVHGDTAGSFSLKIEGDSKALLTNDICENAEPVQITSGDIVELTVPLLDATLDPDLPSWTCETEALLTREKIGLWYSFFGTDTEIQVVKDGGQGLVSVFVGDCDSYGCAALGKEEPAFFSNATESYLLYVHYEKEFPPSQENVAVFIIAN